MIIREMQIKTTPLGIAIIKRTKITNFGEDKGRVKGALLQSWWEYKLVQPLWKTIWYGSFSKTKNLIVIWSRFKIGKGVHQGCVSSHYLFNLYAGFIMQNAGLDEAQFSSVAQSFSHSLWSHGLQHARFPCPSPTPGACSNSCPSAEKYSTIIELLFNSHWHSAFGVYSVNSTSWSPIQISVVTCVKWPMTETQPFIAGPDGKFLRLSGKK